MALIYSPSIRTLIAGSLLRTFGTNYAGINPTRIMVFSGVQPTPEQVIADWTTYSSLCLAYFTDAKLNTPAFTNLIQMSTAPTPVNAITSGTTTWAIIWCGAISTDGPTILSSSAPPTTSFMVVPVSDQLGQGVVRLVNPVLIAGDNSTYEIADITIGALL